MRAMRRQIAARAYLTVEVSVDRVFVHPAGLDVDCDRPVDRAIIDLATVTLCIRPSR